MKEEFEISEKDDNRFRSVYTFGEDKIHRKWEKAFRKGECFYRLSDFSGEYYEFSAFGTNVMKYLRPLVISSTVASILFFGFGDHQILKILGILFFVHASLSIPFIIVSLKTENWVSFSDHKGDGIISFRVKGLKDITKEELIDKITTHIKSHNKAAVETRLTPRSTL